MHSKRLPPALCSFLRVSLYLSSPPRLTSPAWTQPGSRVPWPSLCTPPWHGQLPPPRGKRHLHVSPASVHLWGTSRVSPETTCPATLFLPTPGQLCATPLAQTTGPDYPPLLPPSSPPAGHAGLTFQGDGKQPLPIASSVTTLTQPLSCVAPSPQRPAPTFPPPWRFSEDQHAAPTPGPLCLPCPLLGVPSPHTDTWLTLAPGLPHTQLCY